MKRVFKFMLVAAVASLALVACKKDNNPNNKEKEKEEQKDDPEKEKEPEEEVKLAVDGKFGEWAAVAAVAGEDAILCTKTQTDDKKLYFYVEADVALLETEKFAFANYLHIYIDCGEGTEGVNYWGGEEGCTYDILYEIWLMQGGVAKVAQWYTGVSGISKIENGVLKAEFGIDRTADELLKSKTIWYGISLTDTFCDTSSGAEEWGGGELIGISPAQGEDLAKLK